MRMIATEEAFAPVGYIDEYLKLTDHLGTAPARYLSICYGRPEAVRQPKDPDYWIAQVDDFGVAMHPLSITSPGVQAFGARLGTDDGAMARITHRNADALLPIPPA